MAAIAHSVDRNRPGAGLAIVTDDIGGAPDSPSSSANAICSSPSVLAPLGHIISGQALHATTVAFPSHAESQTLSPPSILQWSARRGDAKQKPGKLCTSQLPDLERPRQRRGAWFLLSRHPWHTRATERACLSSPAFTWPRSDGVQSSASQQRRVGAQVARPRRLDFRAAGRRLNVRGRQAARRPRCSGIGVIEHGRMVEHEAEPAVSLKSHGNPQRQCRSSTAGAMATATASPDKMGSDLIQASGPRTVAELARLLEAGAPVNWKSPSLVSTCRCARSELAVGCPGHDTRGHGAGSVQCGAGVEGLGLGAAWSLLTTRLLISDRPAMGAGGDGACEAGPCLEDGFRRTGGHRLWRPLGKVTRRGFGCSWRQAPTSRPRTK